MPGSPAQEKGLVEGRLSPSAVTTDADVEAEAGVDENAAAFDREKLDSLVADGWLRSQRHPEADLWIYNYTEQTQFENHWTPETLVCRGLILDADGRVVARPFAKFFNYGTPQAVIPNEPFTVTEKIDGSLGILYEIEGGPRIATRGSFTSEQAIHGTAMLRQQDIAYVAGETPLFEIIYPANRIVVDYGDRNELVLLGSIDNKTGKDAPLPSWSGPVVEHHDADDLEALAAMEGANREGFVVAFESGHRVKIKFAEYVRLHKIVTGINAKTIWESLRDGQEIESLLDGVPDEIFSWITKTSGELRAAFDDVERVARRVFDLRPPTDNRKELAAYFTGSDVNPSILFSMLDGKDCAPLIWRMVRPEAFTPAGVFADENPGASSPFSKGASDV